ncbi:MAG TPA: 3-dehydroquinate synthase II family protein [Desulfovibrio sp.]|nr:3-dehydroquinate synthase II family protein [Desulfovibrio sp.]
MKKIIFKAIPFDKKLISLALESGVDAILTTPEDRETVESLGRTTVLTPEDMPCVAITEKADEAVAVDLDKKGKNVCLAAGWEIIPVENLLAQIDALALEAESLDRARLAASVMERGADAIVVTSEGAADLKQVVAELKLSQGKMELQKATVTKIESAGLAHRVCVDTTSKLKKGQGILTGNSSAFTFLVHAETESNPYVAARPFRVNAGAVHAYALTPGDKTCYLEELRAGTEVLVVDKSGETSVAVVGRSKLEVRPMLLITAEVQTPEGPVSGKVFLQNAETIRVVSGDGEPVSVVTLKEGDEVLCRIDEAGRHFGMRIKEEISED